MSKNGQHDTLRRIVTSVSILGATLVLFDGGRGITGRAGGGDVGCGGGFYEDVATEERGQGAGERLKSTQEPRFDVLMPRLQPHDRSLSYSPQQPPSPVTASPAGPGVSRPQIIDSRIPVNPPLPRGGPDVVASIAGAGSARFETLVRQMGLDAVLTTPYRQFTVFAPTDAAVERLMNEQPKLFEPQNQVLLQDLLAHHIVAAEFRAASLASGQFESLVPGGFIDVSAVGSQVSVSVDGGPEASVDVSSEVIASNGVVVLIDNIFVPNFSVWSHIRNSGFNNFVAAVEAAQQVGRFTNPDTELTVLVPSNDAFHLAGWPTSRLHDPGERGRVIQILDAHVIEGVVSASKLLTGFVQASDGAIIRAYESPGQSTVVERDGKTVSAVNSSDVRGGNGYVHGLDALLLQ